MKLKSLGFYTLITLIFLPLQTPVFSAENEEEAAKPAKLFSSSQTLPVKMTAPWRDIQRKKSFDGAYPAQIEFTDDLGQTHTLAMTVERRGITRQKVCLYPPIKLRFEKDAVKGTTFRGQKNLKMVTHCNRGSIFVQYYLKEMLAYQMYNLITDFSFRVRPLSVTYIDSDNGEAQEPLFAFLIEDDSDVAKRNGQKKLKIAKTLVSRLDTRETSNFSLFQYLIANLDWAATSGPSHNECCHNAKLIGQDPEKDPIYPIPYDFDSSGLVDTKYAAPPDGLRVNRVTQRLYRGFCTHNSGLPEAKQRFLDQEQAIYALVKNESRLSSSIEKKSLNYLEKFFEILKDDKDYQNNIIEKCRR